MAEGVVTLEQQLLKASETGDLATVKSVLAQGVNLENARRGTDKATPLHLTCW